jgi:hypothetical protein
MVETIKDARVLFICKQRMTSYKNSVGLINSALFVARKLIELGAEAKVVSVVDNNCIDREVYNYKPTHVIIEALWVVPEKFHVLLPRYPKVTWIVRIHSKPAFISNEGIAFEWLLGYRDNIIKNYNNFYVSSNCPNFTRDLNYILDMGCIFTPNIYDPSYIEDVDLPGKVSHPGIIDVGSFGAIRPMKNTLIQGMSAILYADQKDIKLRFHVNAGRVEQNGESALRNLEALFRGTGRHELVKHEWLSHEDFLLLASTMDLGMQVSFSETFNIVTADMVALGIPVVVSDEIEWVYPFFHAIPQSTDDIVQTMKSAMFFGRVGAWLNYRRLDSYSKDATRQWVRVLKDY